MREGGFCAILFLTVRNLLILKRRDGGVVDRARLESNFPSVTRRHRNTLLHNRVNDLTSQDVPRCDAVNGGIRRRIRAHLTQFLHNSRFHLVIMRGICP